MAFTTFANNIGLSVAPFIGHPATVNSFLNGTIDAVGESVSFVGRVFIEGGSGSKTISAAGGGKIVWATSISVTFANASTNLKVGIQDYNAATGVEDGAYDVSRTLIPGTDTITTNTVYSHAMDTGSKTISHGDIVVIVIEMTARGGADRVDVNAGNNSSWFPHGIFDTGSGPTRNSTAPCCHIIFDDGTYGWFPGYHGCLLQDVTTLASNATPDEIALIFRLPFAAEITELFAQIGAIATTDDFEIILYSSPLTSPSVAYSESFAGFRVGSTGGSADTPVRCVLTTPYTILANTDYAVAVRPTTTNSITIKYIDFGSANSNFRKMTMLGTNWSYGTRSDQTGAFTQTTYKLPYFGFNFKSIENISGGSYAFA